MGTFLTTKEFIKRAQNIHGNKYDYSLTDYKGSQIKVKIICPEHGMFEQRPNDHIQKKGCIMCSGIKKKNKRDFEIDANKVHKNKFNYDLVCYKNNKSKVKIICPNHGEFQQRPSDHLNGFGCAECGRVKKLTTNSFVERAKEKHGKFDYSLVEYENMHTKVRIICTKHGEFRQTPHNHLKFAGCPKCNKSKGEKIISWFLDKKNINYEEQKRFDGCKNKSHLLFDFYLPDYNICVEFQGVQHYKANEHMNGSIGLKKRQINDNIKREFCKKNDIKLVEIKYSDKLVPKLKENLDIK